MKLPSKVKIGPKIFHVIYPYKFPPGSIHVAEICPNACEIRIADVGQSEDELLCEFWHEVFHGADKMTGQCRFEQDNESEEWLEGLTQAFLAIMLDNKLLNMDKFN
jgi:hypothetical protein